MQTILLIGHGSRSAAAREEFLSTAEKLEQTTGLVVKPAFMELAQPSIQASVEELYRSGSRTIRVVPLFLYNGIHIQEDIPEILNGLKDKYAGISFEMGGHIGSHPLLVQILKERCGEVCRTI